MVFKKIRNILNKKNNLINLNVILKYLNKEQYISIYNYMMHQLDDYRVKKSFYKSEKIYIENFDIIRRNIEIQKNILRNKCNYKLNNITEISKKHHQIHMVYCFFLQNFQDKNNKNNFIHEYLNT